ncbi:MAG: hypothetical protein HYT42_00305 [Candidatus Sungbacteria bacterium]|nr:hypothetical protein [Candidatus Sungbacteria bacterium]
MDVVEKLFESATRAKLLKLFLMNPDGQFSSAEAWRQAKVQPRQFANETRRLLKIGIIKSPSARTHSAARVRGGGRRPKHVSAKTFAANKDFPLFNELRMLMLKSAPHAKGKLALKLRRLGNIKLAVLAGVFVDNPNSRVDMLIVGDGFNKSRMKSFIQWLESEIGKELNYVAMSLTEFKYRMDMYDRFVRDVLEFPHETLINKLGV